MRPCRELDDDLVIGRTRPLATPTDMIPALRRSTGSVHAGTGIDDDPDTAGVDVVDRPHTVTP